MKKVWAEHFSYRPCMNCGSTTRNYFFTIYDGQMQMRFFCDDTCVDFLANQLIPETHIKISKLEKELEAAIFDR